MVGDHIADTTRLGIVTSTPKYGRVWVKTARSRFRELITVVTEDGETAYGELSIGAMCENAPRSALYAAIRCTIDRTLKPPILDSEGGWGIARLRH